MHLIDKYIRNPTHNITVNVIGCGGTGSRVLTGLAMINKALVGLNKPHIEVFAFDPDKVTEANIARQMFAPADIGLYKAEILMTRINRFYGTQWDAIPEAFNDDLYQSEGKEIFSNITIMCTDTISSRKEIIDLSRHILKSEKRTFEPNKPIYIIDTGNSYDHGQVTLTTITQGEANDIEGSWWLDQVIEDPNQPSCSMAEALAKQHLFINTLIADNACILFWDLLTKKELEIVGSFINLAKYTTNPIKR